MPWYGPNNSDRSAELILSGGAALGRGIENFGEAIGKALEKRKQQGDLAVAMRKMLQTAYPERKDDFNSMGLAEMQGIVQGEAMKSALEKADRDKQQAQQALDLGRLELDRVKRGPAFFQALAGDLPQVLSPEIMERATRDPMSRLGVAAGTSGYPLDPREGASLVEAMARMAPKPSRGLPLGAMRKVGDIGTIVGTGEDFEPNFVANPQPKDAKTQVPSYPWLFDDDKEQFKQGIMELSPEERTAALAERAAYNRAIGRDDPWREALARILDPKGEAAKASGSTSGARPKVFKFNPTTGKLE